MQENSEEKPNILPTAEVASTDAVPASDRVTPEDIAAREAAQTPIAVEPEKKSNRKKFIIIAVVAILVLVAAGAAVFFLTQRSKAPETMMEEKMESTEETPKPATMSDWNTYEASEFSFKYPGYFPQLTLGKQPSGETPIYESSYLDPKQRDGEPGFIVALSVRGPETNPKNLDLEKWLEANDRETISSNGETVPTDKEVKTVSGKQIIVLKDKLSSPRQHMVYFSVSEGIYSMSYTISTQVEDAAVYTHDFDQILSTFKFTEAKDAAGTSDWKSYKNTQVGYEISYPDGWNLLDVSSGGSGKAASADSKIIDIVDGARVTAPYPSGVMTIQGYSTMPAYDSTWTKTEKSINGVVATVYETEDGLDGPTKVYIFHSLGTPYVEVLFRSSTADSVYPVLEEIAATFKFTK